MAQDIFSGLPPELAAENRRIQKQQQMAEAMMQQSMRPFENQTAGGYVIPISPFAGAAKLLNAYAGRKAADKSDTEYGNLTKSYNEGLAEAIRNYSGGATKTVSAPDMGAMTGSLDQQDAPMVPTQVPVDPRERMVAAMTSPYAPVQRLAGLDYQTAQKEKELGENRAWRTQESQAAREARQAEVDANRAAQAERMRQEQAFRDQQARQAALDRENLARVTGQITASNRPERMITVMGPEGEAITMPQSQAAGMTPYNPSTAKQFKEGKAKKDARQQLNEAVGQLKGYYDSLKEGGGIVSQEQSGFGNLASRVQSTGAGQALGGALGTKNQEARQKIEQTRPLLLNLIKNATGMSAQQMNSNAEMQLYLRAATDPTLSYEANLEALDNLDKLFGLGMGVSGKPPAAGAGGMNPQDRQALEWANANPSDPRAAAIRQRLGGR